MPETATLEIHHVQNNAFVNLEVWDFPGDFALSEGDATGDESKALTDDSIFEHCGALVYVIDIKSYENDADTISVLADWISRAHAVKSNIRFQVLLHKFDTEKQTADFTKADLIGEIEKRVQSAFESIGIDDGDSIDIDYHLTSIYDHTLFELFSHIVQTLFDEHSTLEQLLNVLVEKCEMDKAFLFDVASKIYIAENPPALVDSDRYELSADMIDVVIDVLCIYGSSDSDADGFGFDAEASSVIHLSGALHSKGHVLYLRQVSSELAVVCILQEENFKSKGIVDYNINEFKKALASVVNAKHASSVSSPTAPRDAAASKTDEKGRKGRRR